MLSFLAFKSRNYTNVHFSVSMESSADIGLYMCVHIIPRGKRGGEGGGSGKKGIYIYMIYRVDPFLSAGVVSTRQLALLLCSCIVYMHLSMHAHIFIQAYSLMRAHTHTHAHIRARMCIHIHMTHTSTKYMYAYARSTCIHTPAQCSYMRTYTHARTRLHMRPHSCNTLPHILAAR